MSFCLFVCLSVCLFVCLPACLSFSCPSVGTDTVSSPSLWNPLVQLVEYEMFDAQGRNLLSCSVPRSNRFKPLGAVVSVGALV